MNAAVQDVKNTLRNMRPARGETIEEFARRGLLWQCEVYSANSGHDLDITWDSITDEQRACWLTWAMTKMGDL